MELDTIPPVTASRDLVGQPAACGGVGGLRIAVFTDHAFGKTNGVTTTLRALSRHPAEPWRPRVYTMADEAVGMPDYFSAPSLGFDLPWYREMRIYWPRLRMLGRELRRDGANVVHITTPGPVGLAGRYLARRLRLPVVGSYHTHFGEYVQSVIGSRRLAVGVDSYLRWLYATCRTVLVPSEATRLMLISQGVPADRLRIWPRGVDCNQFSPQRASAALRRSWGVDARRPAILYAGRLSAEKGVGVIADIQRRLYRHGVAHRFIFAGDGAMAASLQGECPDAIFLGRLAHDRMAVAMASADILVFPSTTNAFGTVGLEAQASGLPVLVTDRDGPREQVIDGTTGFVCRAGQVDDFAARLVLLLRSAELRKTMGASAREHALTRTWASALRPLFNAWQEAAGVPVGHHDEQGAPIRVAHTATNGVLS